MTRLRGPLLAPVLALLLGAAAVPAQAATVSAPAAPAVPDADSGGTDGGAPVEAPVPDPFLAEVLKVCEDGASGDKGTFARLEAAGWNLAVDGETQTPFYQAFNGEKDYDGVGTVDITYSLEVYPSMTEGYCSLSIDSAERKIGIGDLARTPGLKGEMRQTDDGIASNWEENVANPTTFIQADQHKRDLYFLLDVTKLMMKPAADIPFVQPDNPDVPDVPNTLDNTNTDSGAEPGTNAAN